MDTSDEPIDAGGQGAGQGADDPSFHLMVAFLSLPDEDKVVIENALEDLEKSDWNDVEEFNDKLKDQDEVVKLLSKTLAGLDASEEDDDRQKSINLLKLFLDACAEGDGNNPESDMEIDSDDDDNGGVEVNVYGGKLYTVAHILKVWEKFLFQKDSGTVAKNTGTETDMYYVEGGNHVSSLFIDNGNLDLAHNVAVVTTRNQIPENGKILAICGVNTDEELQSTLAKTVKLAQVYFDENEANLNGMGQIVFPYKVSGAHWVLGVLNLSSYAKSDRLWNGNLIFYDPKNAFVKVPSSVAIEGIRNQMTLEMKKTIVTQQNDLFSSGVIVAENGKDFLDAMESNKEIRLKTAYDWGAPNTLRMHMTELNLLTGTELPVNDGGMSECDFDRKVYYALAKLINIKNTADWGADLEKWMGEKARNVADGSSQLKFKDPLDMNILEKVYEEVTSRQIGGVWDQYDTLEDLLFEEADLRRLGKGIKVEWRMDIMSHLVLHDFSMFIDHDEKRLAEEAENRRLEDLLQRCVESAVEDGRLKKAYEEELKQATDQPGSKSIEEQIVELEEQCQKVVKELEEAREEKKESIRRIDTLSSCWKTKRTA